MLKNFTCIVIGNAVIFQPAGMIGKGDAVLIHCLGKSSI